MTDAPAHSAPPRPTTLAVAPGLSRRYRPEVQGLRAAALLMVVIYHIWLGRVSGGVDIFLMVSAFFLTGSLARALDEGRPLRILNRWSHQFRRLLPAAAVVILTVLIVARIVYPEGRWADVAQHAAASATYWQNWNLAEEAVDYYAVDHSVASPLQHFWSLSVQGQVFILWPLLAAGVALVAKGRTKKPSRILFWVLSGVFILSLGYSAIETQMSQTTAYFNTFARLYEFAFGGMLAIVIDRIRLPRRPRLILGWAGLVAMLSCGFLLDVNGTFPGVVALWPVLAASAIIVAGQTGVVGSADWILTRKPLRWLGDYSYAMYLWHWPVMITWLVVKGYDRVSLRAGLLIIVVSLILAVLTTRLVERPVRAWRLPERNPLIGFAVLAAMLAAAALPAQVWESRMSAQAAASQTLDANHPGAAALRAGFVDEISAESARLPSAAAMADQIPSFDFACTGDLQPDTELKDALEACRTSTEGDAEGRSGIVLILGDSHMRQMVYTVEGSFRERGYKVISMVYPGCRYGVEEGKTAECVAFNKAVTDYIEKIDPEVIVTTGTRTAEDSPAETLEYGFAETAAELTANGRTLVALRDNHRVSVKNNPCVVDDSVPASDCQLPRDQLFAETSPLEQLPAIEGVVPIDLTDSFCTATTCDFVVGNVMVFKDEDHITKTYAASMAADFETALSAAWDG